MPSKIGPREQRLREMREVQVVKVKRPKLKAKAIGKLTSVKVQAK